LEGPFSGQVATEVSTKREVIAVASASESEKAGDAGFIGAGFTKNGIYVCLPFLFYKHTASNLQATRPGLKVVNMS
jgi:hypothetical protein